MRMQTLSADERVLAVRKAHAAHMYILDGVDMIVKGMVHCQARPAGVGSSQALRDIANQLRTFIPAIESIANGLDGDADKLANHYPP